MTKYIIIAIILSIFSCKNKNIDVVKNNDFRHKEIIGTSKTNQNKKTAQLIYKECLDKLDSIVEKRMPYDHSDGFEAVAFLSEISGYDGEGNQSYFGTLGFKDKDLVYWKEWYKKNEETLNYIYVPKDTLGYDYN